MGASAATARIEAQLDRIAALNPSFRAFTTIDEARGRRRAREVDAAEADGRWLGLLHGMTIAVKDNIDTAGIRTACGSLLFADRIPNADAPVVERLRRAGAVIMGKAAMMELAFGVRSLDAVAGQCRNPWNPAHVPGGIKRRFGRRCRARSLRRRARHGYRRVDPHARGFCGVAGLRPTHGLVSNRGVLPVSVVVRYCRADGAPRRRLGAGALRHCGLRSRGPELRQARVMSTEILNVEADVAGAARRIAAQFLFQ